MHAIERRLHSREQVRHAPDLDLTRSKANHTLIGTHRSEACPFDLDNRKFHIEIQVNKVEWTAKHV
jgi:hypothetical protein